MMLLRSLSVPHGQAEQSPWFAGDFRLYRLLGGGGAKVLPGNRLRRWR